MSSWPADHERIVERATAGLTERPGDDEAHERRARALVALGRLDEAEQDAAAAVRIDPDEVRYRELLAEVLAARGAHRDAAVEYARLARRDPRQPAWARVEATAWADAGHAVEAIEAAERALRLDPADASTQLALTRGLVIGRQAQRAMESAERLIRLLPGDARARETWADAHAVAGLDAAAFAEYAALTAELPPDDPRADGVIDKARSLYRAAPGLHRRLIGWLPGLFRFALRSGRLSLR